MIDPDLKLSFEDAPAVQLVADVVGAAAEAFDYNDMDVVDAAAIFVHSLVDTSGTAGIMSDVLVLHVLDIHVDAYHRQAFVIDDITAAVAQVLVQIAAAVAEHAVVVPGVLTDGNSAVPVDVSAASGASVVAELAVLDMVMKAAAAVAEDIAAVAKKMLAADSVAAVVVEAAAGANMIVDVADAVAVFGLAAAGTAVAEDVADTAMSDSMFDYDLLRYVTGLWMRSSCLAHY